MDKLSNDLFQKELSNKNIFKTDTSNNAKVVFPNKRHVNNII